MSGTALQCSNCSRWKRILEEGASGTPKKAARPGWGECHQPTSELIRIRGWIETHETFLCANFNPIQPTGEPK